MFKALYNTAQGTLPDCQWQFTMNKGEFVYTCPLPQFPVNRPDHSTVIS